MAAVLLAFVRHAYSGFALAGPAVVFLLLLARRDGLALSSPGQRHLRWPPKPQHVAVAPSQLLLVLRFCATWLEAITEVASTRQPPVRESSKRRRVTEVPCCPRRVLSDSATARLACQAVLDILHFLLPVVTVRGAATNAPSLTQGAHRLCGCTAVPDPDAHDAVPGLAAHLNDMCRAVERLLSS